MDIGLEKLLPKTGPLARRSFVTGTVAAGFALSVQPISAQTIVTDASGITAGIVSVPAAGGSIPAYRARPAASAAAPVVLVIQEIFGVHEHIRDVCRRLAKLGYYAVAPELYFRQGDATKVAEIQNLVREIVSKVPDEQVMGDLDSTVAFAKSEGALSDRLAITGFCWGGRITWLYAARNPGVKAGVAWYGRLVGDTSAMNPKHPIDLVGELKCPVLGLYGGADTGIPVATTEQMKKAADAAGKKVEFVVYPDTPHAFHADYRPSYREAAAKDGWSRLQAWFKANGV
jgi:carboxymethylenebutenolidase